MTDNRYPVEELGEDDDNGTMPGNVATLADAVVGHRIVSAERGPVSDPWWGTQEGLILILDNGKKVTLLDEYDCCAYTELKSFLLHPERVDHIITGVGTTDGYSTWHIYADRGDVLELQVSWRASTPFYYSYGFIITVSEIDQ